MMKIFRKSEQVIGAVVDTVDHAMSIEPPLPSVPNVTGEFAASIGDDFNLVLLVKEHGAIRHRKLNQRRQVILDELKKIDQELLEIDVLLNAVNSLEPKK